MKQEPKERKAVPLPWHPAFFAGLQIELREEAEQLYFEQEHLYESIMDLIARANARTFQEVKEMCQALEELMRDELEDREQRGMEAGIEVGMERGIEKGIEKGIEAMIRAFRNLNITEGEICRQLQKECHLSEEAARRYMSRR